MTAIDDPKLAPALALADEIVDAGADLLLECSYGNDELVLAKVMLACTILDGMSAIIALLRSSGQAHADTVARSMFEALGDLCHLCSSSQGGLAHYHRMEMTSALNVKDNVEDLIPRRVSDPDAALVLAVAKDMAKEAKATIARLSSIGVPKNRLSVIDRVQAPGLSNEIAGMYTEFCFDAHHDLTSLRKRHFRGKQLVFGDTLQLGSAYSSLVCGSMIAVACFNHFRNFPKAVTVRFPALIKKMDSAALAIHQQSMAVTLENMTTAGWNQDGTRR